MEHPETGVTVIIHEEYLGTALHGDTVAVSLLAGRDRDFLKGEVTGIVSRARTRFTGTIELVDGMAWLVLDDRRAYTDFHLQTPLPREAVAGYKALIELVRWDDPKKSPEGRIVRVIGPAGDNETEMRAIAESAGFEPELAPALHKEAEAIAKNALPVPESQIAERRDMRGVLTSTIDPADAKDFDDALSFSDLGDGVFEIGVHIADVSHYVRPETAIDKEARERATSVYLVDRTIPMLPEVLSNNVCSLVPNEDRLTFSAIFTIKIDGTVINEWFGRTVIHSDRRFTYEEAQMVLDGKEPTAGDMAKFGESLLTMNSIAKSLRKRREQDGAITFDLDDEVKFRLDEKGKPLEVVKKVRTDSHLLVEDFMLLANKRVAEYVQKLEKNETGSERKVFFVYRNHDLPNVDSLDQLSVFLKAFGMKLEHGGKGEKKEVDPHALNKILKEVSGTEMEHLVSASMLRSMAKAVYSTKNIGHYGLAFGAYTHFTSPIRRYPDIMVHRLLSLYLAGKTPNKGDRADYEHMCAVSSARERGAMEAERESVKLKQVEYMVEHIGTEFWGVISGVTDYGFFVETIDTRCEGFVALRNLGDDFYEHDKKKYAIYGKQNKRRFRLGDKLKIKVSSANPASRQLDFSLVV
ncbi:MAG: ribonuclease R [Candidatus Vogelbacteria bacterium CG10_big_fil_rev_8_21_14_0_10_45_14]|uniref:Ribonuclease R n=1 Tax=Candidatus Vogelbacteria bacterium CG10_big_fil_rev_8_21_14_0_10_45_14 TaxID=1975042 RepID=A0A2H0RIW3_9BACT|nr:MAG: ribonuclease R [Candidatus Vogelbacteria bacterium CG10_big_fil_rev_8_21_14_0_10_45_14]